MVFAHAGQRPSTFFYAGSATAAGHAPQCRLPEPGPDNVVMDEPMMQPRLWTEQARPAIMGRVNGVGAPFHPCGTDDCEATTFWESARPCSLTFR